MTVMKRWLALLLAIVLLCPVTALAGNNTDYDRGVSALQRKDYSAAAGYFSAAGDYADAPQLAMYCAAVNAGERGMYSIAVNNLVTLGNFRDSALLARYYAAISYEMAQEYETAEEKFQGMELYRDVMDRLSTYPEKIKIRDYNKADRNEKAGKLEEALKGFKALGSYKDSRARAEAVQEKINSRDYNAADQLESKNKLEEALKAFKALGSYKDSPKRVKKLEEKIRIRDEENAEAARAAAYAKADKAEKDGDYASALSGFTKLGDYRDSKARAAAVKDKGNYAQALQLANSGKFSQAYNMFVELGNYQDSAEKAYALGVTTFASKVTDRKNGTAIFQFHGLWGLINVNTNTTVSPYWDEISSFNEWGLAKVTKDKKYGYIDRQGNVVIPADWAYLSDFKDGLCVMGKTTPASISGKSNYLFGMMDSQGRTVTSAQWRTLGTSNNSTWNPGKYSSNYINIYAPAFSEGRIKVQNQAGKWGFLDMNGLAIGEVKWDSIADFSEGLAAVTENNKYGYINKEGRVVIAPQYDYANAFKEGLAAVRVGTYWRYIDQKNHTVISANYTQVNNFRGGKADVFLENTGWQIIDMEGRLLYFINEQTVENYNQAKSLMNRGEYSRARDMFLSLAGYQDSTALAQECYDLQYGKDYDAALSAMNGGNYAKAIERFTALGAYRDSAAMAKKCQELLQEEKYQQAVSQMNAGNYPKAIEAFKAMGTYKDSAAMVKKCIQLGKYNQFTVTSMGTYGFKKNSSGYYVSGNKGIQSSYALCKITFTSATGKIYLDCINYAESGKDYGMISKLNTPLAQSYSADSSSKLTKSFSSSSYNKSSTQTTVIDVTPYTEQTIYVKYIKNSSTNRNNDTFQFKVRFE